MFNCRSASNSSIQVDNRSTLIKNSPPLMLRLRRLFAASCLVAGVGLILSLPARAEDRHVQRRVPPVYPEIAKRMKIGGVVKISATVAADGTVTEAKAVSGNRMLVPAAEDAVKHWKFTPADSTSSVDVEVNFSAD